MPVPARLVVFGPGMKPLPGSAPLLDLALGGATASEIHEFAHQVYTVQKDYYYALLYGTDFIRRHDPMRLVKPLDTMSVSLMHYLITGTFLPQVEVRWYEFDANRRRVQEYFRMTLEHVRINSIVTMLPDTKDQKKERYTHGETVTFSFQKITWLYKRGYLLFTDIWNGGFFSEEDEKDFSGKNKEDTGDDTTDATTIISLFKVTFTEGAFVKPETGFQFDKKSRVRFTSTVNRKPDPREGKVYAKLSAVYNGKTEDLHQVQGGRLREDGSWETEFTLRKPEAYEKDRERPSDAKVEYYAEIENRYVDGNFRSESITVPEQEEDIIVPWFIDVHAHVQSTDCCPGPLKRGRSFKEYLKLGLQIIPGFAGTPGLLSPNSTEKNAVALMKKSEEVLNDKKLELMGPVDKRRRLVVNMPMDMDFGHWGGYEGKKIYEKDENGYWENGVEGRKPLRKRKYEKVIDYPVQLNGIQKPFITENGNFVSFFHYDPRRWSFKKYNQAQFVGQWDDPFSFMLQVKNDEEIKSALMKYKMDKNYLNIHKFAGIGFKMYTALGYRPDDLLLPDLSKFYQKCSQPDLAIPIICHCSRGGLLTHEWSHYYKKQSPAIELEKHEIKEWYAQEFISPFAWERVLKKFPNLKLCLAHFGGEECWGKQREKQKHDWFAKLIELMKSTRYPNVYVDMAYFLFDDSIIDQFAEAVKDDNVRQKILFGTDWYLMEMEWTKIGLLATYKHYFERVYNGFRNEKLKAIDKSLLAQITVVNPMKFLGIKKLAPKIDLLRKTLGKADADLTSWVNEIPDFVDDFPRVKK